MKTPADTPTRHVPRTLREVEDADPTDLALMTRAQVDNLPDDARQRRADILRNDRTTRWDLRQIMAYLGVKRSSVSRFRWRERRGEVNGSRTVLPKPLPKHLHDPELAARAGRPGPQWLMSKIVTDWAPGIERCDRIDYVAFPRKRPGRPPAQRSSASDATPQNSDQTPKSTQT